MATKIIKCTCDHEGQDSLHGKKNRVANKTVKTSGTKEVYRCTVCEKLH